MDVRVAAYAVIIREGCLLLAHWNEHGRSGWTLPGGGLEDFETPSMAAVREVLEETGYSVHLDGLLEIDSVYIPQEHRFAGTGPLHALRVLYTATIIDGKLTVERDGSTDDARWVPLAEVASLHTVALVETALSAYARGSATRP
jgi:8-oxo-dGTP diphosphatase